MRFPSGIARWPGSKLAPTEPPGPRDPANNPANRFKRIQSYSPICTRTPSHRVRYNSDGTTMGLVVSPVSFKSNDDGGGEIRASARRDKVPSNVEGDRTSSLDRALSLLSPPRRRRRRRRPLLHRPSHIQRSFPSLPCDRGRKLDPAVHANATGEREIAIGDHYVRRAI